MVSVTSTLATDNPDQPSAPALALLNPTDAQRVEQALDYIRSHANGQVLDTQEPAIQHMLAVADLLAELRTDADTRIAGALGPMVFFDKHLENHMEARFGAEVGRMLASLRKLFKMRSMVGPNAARSAIETLRWADQMETLRKMLLAMATDVRVIMIRLCSRLQTLRHFTAHPDIKAEQGPLWNYAQQHAQETLELYAPLANRLGLWQLKWELEDLSFRILQPNTYKNVAKMLDEKRTEREAFIESAMQTIKDALLRAGIHCEISGRPKHIYSIWNKMRGKGVSFDKLYDVRACRVIVGTVDECYTALGIVHNLWQPIPEEFDDYISKPKPNGYRSLHTVVQDPTGKALEVQIRTEEMHQFAEYGVAAHWRYKEAGTDGYSGASRAEGAFEERIALLRQLLAWQKDVTDTLGEASDWAQDMQIAALNDHVYVFTPQAKIVELPTGSTPLDFAYHVHTELGHRCRGAKVNGQMVQLNTPLENGQTIEIVSARGDAATGPSRDWLNPTQKYLVSHRARQKVKQWFAQQERRETLDRGKAMADKELQRIGFTAQNQDELAQKLGYDKAEDLYVALAREEIRPRAIEHALKGSPADEGPLSDEEQIEIITRRKGQSDSKQSGVLVVGVSTLMTNLARCCRPAPPDPIIGFVTRGKGVSIHRLGCSNLAEVMRKHPERLIETTWGESDGLHYPVDISITANDRQGLLRDITEVFSRDKINVIGVKTESTRGVAKMQFTAEVGSGEILRQALSHLLEVDGVFDVRRR
ncbi:bifunctional (p)ppGpp synthetase/guanosine-3',5'-bis(diphosphate) 3'-pyrophosphohydrolase [Limnobacter humi]|uniref:GTP pyrophosphokinase n=1 Tax=Limnobacter humi TaxID=1778671 RepID=A0ABT1WIG7_9BURK|nr:bifunctional (p)ppGpp synthetase/guanosine-3',5'-bis(diphosphate) 3'-pyrophosphohydrolase [Limnobacter humi]MCQ8897311.1 bifunctional (p)ppGpp synthetase/guanosine-3',5'-bis(diphosphate) 3'-pyrophosphohydrolase [Limnobacter humi]